MSDDPTPRHGDTPGQPGYRKSCRCGACRDGHARYVAGWRARKREKEIAAALADADPLIDEPTREPVVEPVLDRLDMKAKPGPIERALLKDLRKPDPRVAFRRHRVRLARLNARVLDQIDRLDRLDLVSPIELRQAELLRDIARLGFDGLDDDANNGGTVEVPDTAAALFAELTGEGE
ncbi:MAG: hypothetical protein HGA44_08525 [Cellulomonadaceae bacterium]|nr:hypothetical protein [Cellulomonadaceae bacterium]